MDASWQGVHRRTVDKTKWLIMDPLEGILRLLRELASVAGKEVETVDATRSELCREQMCLGTPHDIARLYQHGYGNMMRPGRRIGEFWTIPPLQTIGTDLRSGLPGMDCWLVRRREKF